MQPSELPAIRRSVGRWFGYWPLAIALPTAAFFAIALFDTLDEDVQSYIETFSLVFCGLIVIVMFSVAVTHLLSMIGRYAKARLSTTVVGRLAVGLLTVSKVALLAAAVAASAIGWTFAAALERTPNGVTIGETDGQVLLFLCLCVSVAVVVSNLRNVIAPAVGSWFPYVAVAPVVAPGYLYAASAILG